MEKYGLSLEELEAQNVELLPDRIEMKHRRGKRQRVVCQSVAGVVAGDDAFGDATSINFCPALQA
jgi:hypothetical protein